MSLIPTFKVENSETYIIIKKTNLLVVLLLILMACKDDTKVESQSIEIGDFSFSSKDIVANQPFQITYNGNEELEESFYYQLKAAKSFPLDLDFENKTATITVPDSISAVAFNFKIDGNYANNNKEGFLFSVIDASGKVALDAEASKQYYASSGDGSDYGINVEQEKALSTLEQTLDENPELNSDWMLTHLYLAQKLDPEKSKEVQSHYLLMLNSKEELSLNDYDMLSSIYRLSKDTKRSDSLSKIIAEKYPNSKLTVMPILDGLFSTKDLSIKDSIFKVHNTQILKSEYSNIVLRHLALTYYKKGDQDTYNSYVNMMDSPTEKASLYNSIAWPKAEKGEDLDAAAELSKKSLELLKTEQKELKDQPDYYSPRQYKNSLERTYNMYADTYGLLLFKKDDIKEAIKYQAIAADKGKSPEVNERYIQFLMADEQYEMARENASKYIEEGNSTANIKSFYKEAVSKSDPSQDADMLLVQLEAKAKELELENLRKTLLDDDAPDFTLKNLDGEDVTLSSLKGKTVILDFWATWCAPCIASFPGMQNAVTKYKDDDKVAFLFIDTFEDGKDRLDKVAQFIKDNKYDFNVLIDPKAENGGPYEVANKYKVSGIPTKVIIGPSGRINFISVGYSGSTEKVISEIDGMVAILKE